MVGWLKFNIIEKIPFMVYLEIQCITFKMEKSFIAHPWIQRSVVGLEEYSAIDWRAATSGTARSSYLARVGPVGSWTLRPVRLQILSPGKNCVTKLYWLCVICVHYQQWAFHTYRLYQTFTRFGYHHWYVTFLRDFKGGISVSWLLMPFCVNTDTLKHTTH